MQVTIDIDLDIDLTRLASVSRSTKRTMAIAAMRRGAMRMLEEHKIAENDALSGVEQAQQIELAVPVWRKLREIDETPEVAIKILLKSYEEQNPEGNAPGLNAEQAEALRESIRRFHSATAKQKQIDESIRSLITKRASESRKVENAVRKIMDPEAIDID